MINQIFILQPADMLEDIEADFFVMDASDDPVFVAGGNGNIKSFNTYQKAKENADRCQPGFVIIF